MTKFRYRSVGCTIRHYTASELKRMDRITGLKGSREAGIYYDEVSENGTAMLTPVGPFETIEAAKVAFCKSVDRASHDAQVQDFFRATLRSAYALEDDMVSVAKNFVKAFAANSITGETMARKIDFLENAIAEVRKEIKGS